MTDATMAIIVLSIMNATRRKSQWFMSNCELLPVDIFHLSRYFSATRYYRLRSFHYVVVFIKVFTPCPVGARKARTNAESVLALTMRVHNNQSFAG
jgi:hypothetical protein